MTNEPDSKTLEALQTFEFGTFSGGDRVVHQDENGNLTVCAYSEGHGGQLGPDKVLELTLTEILELAHIINSHIDVFKAIDGYCKD